VGTRRLTLLRHGKAQSIDACAEDFERTLTRRGIIEAREMAMRIVYRDLIPDLILVSPAERAWATAEIVAAACELDAKQVQCARELYLATPEATWRLLNGRDAALRHIMICGHNPGLSQIASRLGPKPQARELPTVQSLKQGNCRPRASPAPSGTTRRGKRSSPRPPSASTWTTRRAWRTSGCRGFGPSLLRLAALQAHQPPPIAFVRARVRPGPRHLRQPLLLP
jgi:phosphohistidine phosphatase